MKTLAKITLLLLGLQLFAPSVKAVDKYYGLFTDPSLTNGVEVDRSGYFELTRNGTAISIRISVDGCNWGNALSNTSPSSAISKTPINRSARGQSNLVVQVQFPTSDTITGSISNVDGSWVSELSGYRYIPTTSYAGKYTMAIPGDPTYSASVPGGYGYGLVTVDDTGVLKLAASKLADGQNLLQKVPLNANGDWPLFSRANKGTNGLFNSIIMGWMNVNVSNGITGTLQWVKRPVPTDRNYTEGFRIVASPLSSPYYSTPPTLIFGSLTNADVLLEGGGLSGPVSSNNLSLIGNKLMDKSLLLRVGGVPATGKYTVDLKTTNGVVISYQGFGVALTNQNVVVGYFLNSSNHQSGAATILMH